MVERKKTVGKIDTDLIMLGSVDVPLYLIDLGGRRWAIIDAGISKDFDIIWDQIQQWVQSPEDITSWFVTHKHYDHCGLLSYICPLLPNVNVVVSKKTMASWQSEKSRNVVEMLNKKIGFNKKNIAFTPLHKLTLISVSHGDEYILSDSHKLQIIETPGHASDHIAFYDEQRQRLFAGDALGELNDQTLEWNPLMFDNVSQYLESLHNLSLLPVKQILLGHGGMITGEKINREIERIKQQTIRFIYDIEKSLNESADKEKLASTLTKKWGQQSQRFVPHALHLNSMRYMLSEIEQYLLQNTREKHV